MRRRAPLAAAMADENAETDESARRATLVRPEGEWKPAIRSTRARRHARSACNFDHQRRSSHAPLARVARTFSNISLNPTTPRALARCSFFRFFASVHRSIARGGRRATLASRAIALEDSPPHESVSTARSRGTESSQPLGSLERVKKSGDGAERMGVEPEGRSATT